jgi:hypothetical protein
LAHYATFTTTATSAISKISQIKLKKKEKKLLLEDLQGIRRTRIPSTTFNLKPRTYETKASGDMSQYSTGL